MPAPAPSLQQQLEATTERIKSAQVIARAIVEARKNMTAKVQGAPSRFDRLIANAESAMEKAFTRLEAATEKTHGNVATIEGVAATVEKSNQMMSDRLNQMTNGGPPFGRWDGRAIIAIAAARVKLRRD